ncbi:polysaccharide biosynthesis tyrosine autokinase [Ruegeria sp.]|uniref:GumC family protein n=1 Tax=Ruegeria sp. TaxID=1879320 RepID=UPI0023221F95|nr:polysaccharide biosynthesis tyrosine autokinase [Ruegeria sp.]MDA7963533.1 AAA family ATPase [Ruegeria sp.]
MGQAEASDAQTEPAREAGDLFDLLALAWAGKWAIACATLIGGMLALGGALYLVKPLYQSDTTLVLDPEPDLPNGAGLAGLSTDISAINTQIEVIGSRQMMRDLVVHLGLTDDPEFNPALRPGLPFISAPSSGADALSATAETVANAITITNVRNSRVLTLTARSRDAGKAATIANALAALYVGYQIEAKQRDISDAVSWLSERVAKLEDEIKQQEVASRSLNAALLASEAEALALRISDTKSRLSALSQQQNSLMRQSDMLAGSDVNDPETTFDDPGLRRLAKAARSGDPLAVEEFDRRKADIQAKHAHDLTRIARQSASLQIALEQLEAEYTLQTKALADLQQIEREARATELLHQTFLSRLKETALRSGLQTADSRVVSPATSGEQIAPRTTWMVAFGLLAGAALGMGLVIWRHARQSAIPTAAQMETATDCAVLGQLPQAPIRKPGQLVEYLVQNPTAPLVESARNLRTSLLLGVAEPPQVILSTSAVPDEGKTTTAIALAHNLAGLGRSVLLLEADIRRLSFHDYFDDNPSGGLVSALSQTASLSDLIRRDTRIGVDILLGEHSTRSAADLFAAPAFQDLLKRLRQEYDHIVIDSPPVLAVPDARVIGQSADAILLSVATATTRREQVQQALREFSSVNLRVAGLVMSDLGNRAAKAQGYGAYSQYYAA